jgi:hypothetical protein
MDVKNLIIRELKKKGQLKASDITAETGFSRVYVNRFFRLLRDEEKIVLVDKANRAHYVAASSMATLRDADRPSALRAHRVLRNVNLKEDLVLEEMKAEGSILAGLAPNVSGIVAYAFTEMLNNAIEHSGSPSIDVVMERNGDRIAFDVSDKGVGVFRNIMQKKHLGSPLEAIQDLLKGKETTAPAFHSGEGIFFTSKLGDLFKIRSFEKKLVFDNTVQDIYIEDLKRPVKGTKVFFSIGLSATRDLAGVFGRYTDDNLEFTKTAVKVKLYRQGVDYVSRSQARRLVTGLERFKTVELDFSGVGAIGQGFADEIFRVWHSRYPDIKLIATNTNDNVRFMIGHATKS